MTKEIGRINDLIVSIDDDDCVLLAEQALGSDRILATLCTEDALRLGKILMEVYFQRGLLRDIGLVITTLTLIASVVKCGGAFVGDVQRTVERAVEALGRIRMAHAHEESSKTEHLCYMGESDG